MTRVSTRLSAQFPPPPGESVVMAQGLAELAKPDHKAHELLESVRGQVQGACSYGAGAFGVKARLFELGYPLLSDYKQCPSIHARVRREGYALLTF